MNADNRFALGLFAAVLVMVSVCLYGIQSSVPVTDLRPSGPSPLPSVALKTVADEQAGINDHTPYTRLRDGVVQVRLHSVTFAAADAPLRGLTTVCERFPRQRLVRVTWYDYGKQNSGSTALYDRQRHTLRFHCHGFDRAPFFKHAVFSGVTDAVLEQDARHHTDPRAEDEPETTALAFFDDLPEYGCAVYASPPAPRAFWHQEDGLWWRTG